MRLRLLVPAIALIVAATMIPVGLRRPSLRYIQYVLDPADFLNNILLYMPLGIALCATSLRRAFFFGLSLSTAAELLQSGYIDRIPSPLDITSNTSGAMIGYLAAMLFLRATGHDPKTLRIPRLIAATAILIAVLGAVALVRNPPKSDFSNWNPGFHVAIGNELTGDRPWQGTISTWQIYPIAMTPSQIDDLARQAANSSLELPNGLVPADSMTVHGLLSRQKELHLYDSLVSQNQLTLLVAMRPDTLDQMGPARIITYSQNAFNRNFTLGQIHDILTFRLRTPATGGNGTNPALFTGPVLSLQHTSFVAAVYDGRHSRLYVDGKLVAQADLGAKRPHLPRRIFAWLPGSIPIREIELGASEALLSGLLAIGIFALVGVPQRPSIRLLAGALAGVAIGAFIWIFGVTAPGLGLRILLECIAGGLVMAASVETETADDRS
jgi:hypothetical protein